MIRSELKEIQTEANLQTSIIRSFVQNENAKAKQMIGFINFPELKRQQIRGNNNCFSLVEKSKALRRSTRNVNKNLLEKEEIWSERERDFKKSISRIRFQRNNDVEALILIILFFFLFILALYLAPNQFYDQGKNK